MLASPVPIHIVSGFEGETATSPMDVVPYWSKTHSHVVPRLTVFQSPPEAAAAKITASSRGSTAISTIRPLITVGQSHRQSNASFQGCFSVGSSSTTSESDSLCTDSCVSFSSSADSVLESPSFSCVSLTDDFSVSCELSVSCRARAGLSLFAIM